MLYKMKVHFELLGGKNDLFKIKLFLYGVLLLKKLEFV